MAEIVLGLGTSHSPQLSTPPEEWETGHAAKDRRDYADIFEERSQQNASWIGPELTLERWREKYAAVDRAVRTLTGTVERIQPDVVVIVGDDQREVFKDDGTPAMAVYWGDHLEVVPPDLRTVADFRRSSKWAEYWDEPTTYQCDPSLGAHIIETLVEREFDVTQFSKMPEGRQIGHAFNFACKRVLATKEIPYVPVLLNVFYGMNQPSARRCYAFGQALHDAITSWPEDKRVAVLASGGLSHTLIDEEMDRAMLAAMERKDPEGMTSWPESRFRYPKKFGFGTSETKSWIAVAGAMEQTDLSMEVVDYIPLYRASVGSGVGAAFARWV
ncbi:MAG: hypothetical protein IH968_12970 [Gemmatimonadetes bacterium]|nr:hypothetical protein [Gemmatimonadota bacterium]